MASVESRDLRHRPTLSLVRDLTHQASTLAHQEVELIKVEINENIELAKAEMAEKGKAAGIGLAALIVAGAAALLGLGALSAFLILALDGAMPNWTAALCVAALWAIVAVPFAIYGRNKLDAIGAPVPERTLEAVKEDVAWFKDQTS